MTMRLWLISALILGLALPALADDIRREELARIEDMAASELPADNMAAATQDIGMPEDDILMAEPEEIAPAIPAMATPEPTPRPAPPAASGPPNTYTITPAASARYPTQHPGSPAEYFYDNYRLRFTYGGWLFSTLANYRNPDHSALPDGFNYAADHQLRLYGKWTTEAGGTAYLRLRGSYIDVEQNAGYQGSGSDFAGPAVDLAYWRWSPEIPQFLSPTPQHRMTATLGRQFFRLGRGLAYANRMDGGRLDYHTAWWDFSLFALRTVPGTDNIDPTVPGGGRSAHTALGFTVDFTGFRDHTIYLFCAKAFDHSREFPNDDFQEYDCDPVHIGVGATGQALTDMKYWFEFINETGWSSSSGSEQGRERIHAHSFDLGLQQFFPRLAGRPSFLLQYLSATGDGDRLSATGASGGNRDGSSDHAFNYFGYAPLGLAWDPLLTNLEVTKVGATIQPLRLFGLAEHDATLALSFLQFERNRPDGVISDWSAIPPDKLPAISAGNTHLGNEVDLSLTAPICPGTSVNANLGLFRPGQGFVALPGTTVDFRQPSRYYSFGLVQEF